MGVSHRKPILFEYLKMSQWHENALGLLNLHSRSEERRVGKEC